MKSSELRAKARESLTGNYWPAVLVAFIAAIFGALITSSGSINLNIDEETAQWIAKLPQILKMYLAVFLIFL